MNEPFESLNSIMARNILRRKLSFWRILALGGLAIVVLISGIIFAGPAGPSRFVDHVARIHINGMITGDQATLEMLQDLKKDQRVRAVLMHIDSPGGTTAGSEALYLGLRDLSAEKPIVAVLGTVAASGGYIAALGADHIIARGNSITGSVGVIFQMPEVSRLMDQIGVNMLTIKSGSLKAEPSPFSQPSDEAISVSKDMVDDGFKWFSSLVRERRQLNSEQMRLISDGRVFTGRQATSAGLIDGLGGESQARQWLSKKRQISEAIPIQDWKVQSQGNVGFLGMRLLNHGLAAMGFTGLANMIEKTFVAETLRLDGLLSLWQP